MQLKHFFVKFIDDEENNGARALAYCAPCIESLHIRFSEISAEGYGYISEGIRQKDVPVRNAYYSWFMVFEVKFQICMSVLPN